VRKILIVDDNLASRELMRAVLKRSCAEILEACDGKEALEMIHAANPDLVLLDIELPIVDGIGVIRHIRQDPQTSRLPVLAVTANAMQGDQEKILEEGFDGYIAKPIHAASLRKQVEDILGRLMPKRISS
jgi:two-component system cell cycle response regulator DivK